MINFTQNSNTNNVSLENGHTRKGPSQYFDRSVRVCIQSGLHMKRLFSFRRQLFLFPDVFFFTQICSTSMYPSSEKTTMWKNEVVIPFCKPLIFLFSKISSVVFVRVFEFPTQYHLLKWKRVIMKTSKCDEGIKWKNSPRRIFPPKCWTHK